ncbi:hypothetical protein D3C86_785550 [compost metagenome]
MKEPLFMLTTPAAYTAPAEAVATLLLNCTSVKVVVPLARNIAPPVVALFPVNSVLLISTTAPELE